MSNKKVMVQGMFDSIAHRYDLLNHLLSGGVDIYWRKRALKLGNVNSNSILLDVACGTGDFAIEAMKYGATKIFGADLSRNMLLLFNKKREWSKGNVIQIAAEDIPFKSNSFSHITVAFGVRNFYDISKAFSEFFSILKPNGKAVILEFSMPKNFFVAAIYKMYFKYILPLIGRIISKSKSAYTYLPESVEEFDKKIDLVKIFKECGFRKVEKFILTFGLVQVVIAEK